jgi:tetratricopeptide (TPR) repeat protein
LYNLALGHFDALVREFAYNAQYRRDQAITLSYIALALANLNRTNEAIEFSRRAIALQQQIADRDTRNASFRLDLTHVQETLVQLLGNVGKRLEAMDVARQALIATDRLVSEQPQNPQFRCERARVRLSLGNLANSAGDWKTALDHFRTAESELAELVDRHPDRSDFRAAFAQSHTDVARALRANGDRAGALAKFRQALDEQKRIAAGKNPGDAIWAQLAAGHRWVAAGLTDSGDLAGAIQEQRRAIALLERLLTLHPDRQEYRSTLSWTYIEVAGLYIGRDTPAVIENAGKALPFLEAQYAEDRSASGRLDALAAPLRQIAAAYSRQGELGRAIETRRRLVQMREEFAALDPTDARRAQSAAFEISFLAPELWDSGDRQGCVDAARQALATLERFPPEKVGDFRLRRDWAMAYVQQTRLLGSIRELQSSVATGRKAVALLEGLHREVMDDEITRENLASCHRLMHENLMRLGEFAKSLEHVQRSVELQAAVTPEIASRWRAAAYLAERAAVLRGRLGDPAAMEQGLRKAIQTDERGCVLAEQAWKSSPKSMAALRDLYYCETAIMRSLIRLGEQRQALDYARKAVSHAGARIIAGDQFYQLEEDTVRPDAVLLAWQLAGEQADYTGILDPATKTPERIRYYLAHGFGHRGDTLADDGLWKDSMDARKESAKMFEALLREGPRNKEYRLGLALSERSIGQAYLSNAERADSPRSDLDNARTHLERARTLALELQVQRLLPEHYVRLPGQLASEIAAGEALARASAIPR